VAWGSPAHDVPRARRPCHIAPDLPAQSWRGRKTYGHPRAPRGAGSRALLWPLRRYSLSIAKCRLRNPESAIRNPQSEIGGILLSCQSKYVTELMNRNTKERRSSGAGRLSLAIETLDITKRFPKTKSYRETLLRPFARQEMTALRSISLKVRLGETFALVGPNGAGKTTLIKILSTLVLPSDGHAFVAGYDVERQAGRIKRRIGCVVAEERSFYWRLTGRQNLDFFAVLNNIPRAAATERVNEIIAVVGLEKDADKMFKDFSTGMRHRLAMARALLTDPEILFFDEPTRSLDPSAAEAVRRLIAALGDREPKRTVFFATHDLQEAEKLAGRIALLDNGTIRACGTLSQLRGIARAKRQYALKLRHPNERAIKLLRGLSPSVGSTGDVAAEEASFLIEVAAREEVASVVRQLVLAGGEIVECVAVEPSLAEIFHLLIDGNT